MHRFRAGIDGLGMILDRLGDDLENVEFLSMEDAAQQEWDVCGTVINSGFLPMTVRVARTLNIFASKLHVERCLIDLEKDGFPMSKKRRKRIKGYHLRVRNTVSPQLVENLRKYTWTSTKSDNWLTPELEMLYSRNVTQNNERKRMAELEERRKISATSSGNGNGRSISADGNAIGNASSAVDAAVAKNGCSKADEDTTSKKPKKKKKRNNENSASSSSSGSNENHELSLDGEESKDKITLNAIGAEGSSFANAEGDSSASGTNKAVAAPPSAAPLTKEEIAELATLKKRYAKVTSNHIGYPNVKFWSVEMYDESGKCVAGEMGYSTGCIYTSCTGYYDHTVSGAGTAQLILLGDYLVQKKVPIWDLGMFIEYKADLGGSTVPRMEWIRTVRKHRNTPLDLTKEVDVRGLLMAFLQKKKAGDVEAVNEAQNNAASSSSGAGKSAEKKGAGKIGKNNTGNTAGKKGNQEAGKKGKSNNSIAATSKNEKDNQKEIGSIASNQSSKAQAKINSSSKDDCDRKSTTNSPQTNIQDVSVS